MLGQILNNSALVQVMWCRPGDKPLSEPLMTQFTVIRFYFMSCLLRVQLIQINSYEYVNANMDRTNANKTIIVNILPVSI